MQANASKCHVLRSTDQKVYVNYMCTQVHVSTHNQNLKFITIKLFKVLNGLSPVFMTQCFH